MGLKQFKTSTFDLKHYQFTIIGLNGSRQFQFYRFGTQNGSLTLTLKVLVRVIFLLGTTTIRQCGANLLFLGIFLCKCRSMKKHVVPLGPGG